MCINQEFPPVFMAYLKKTEENGFMNNKDFQALISLLDDDDPEVSRHVWSRLIEIGSEHPDKLEAAWEEEEDPDIQRKIEEVLHKVSLQAVFSDLKQWRMEGGKDLLEGWNLLSRYRYPDLDPVLGANEINRLVNKTWLAINTRMTSQQKLRVLNHILFTVEGFRNSKQQPQVPDFNYISNVFRRKKGNPVTLGMLYLIICRKLELPVHGVLLPGYFILMFLDRDEEFFIDVYNGGLFFKKADLKRFLKENKVPEKPSFFKPTSNIYIILHLINYMIKDYTEKDEPEKVEELKNLLDYIEVRLDEGDAGVV